MRIANKIFLTGLLCFVGVAVSQPAPFFTGQPILIKGTGVTCTYCGGWGWTQFHDGMEKNVFPVAAYCSNFNGYKAGEQNLNNAYSNGLLSMYGITSFPTLYVNDIKTSSVSAQTSAINAHLAKTWTMGMNFEAWTEGNSIKVARVFKTNEALTGNWQLNTFVTEDGIVQSQSGYPGGMATHMAALRYTSTTISGSNRGTVLSGTALTGDVYRDTITIPMNSLWKKDNLKIGLVLFKEGKIFNTYTRANTWLGEVPKTQFSLSVAAENGSVLRTPNQTTYDSASTITLKATPDYGYRFTGWSGALTGTQNPATVTMSGNKQAVANFEQDGSVVVIPQNQLSIFAFSSQEIADNGEAVHLLDGNSATIWHSRWSTNKATPPHWVVIKLSTARAISGLLVQTRNDGGVNGNLKGYSVYLSNDGTNWGTAVATGTATATGGATEEILFDAQGMYTYVRLVWNTTEYGSAGEINLLYDQEFAGETPSSSSSVSSSSSQIAESSSSSESAALTFAGQQSLQLLNADAQGIRFTLSAQGTTNLRLVTITGQQLFEKTVSGEGGTQEISWGRALNKGIYFATLRSSLGARQSIRFVVR